MIFFKTPSFPFFFLIENFFYFFLLPSIIKILKTILQLQAIS